MKRFWVIAILGLICCIAACALSGSDDDDDDMDTDSGDDDADDDDTDGDDDDPRDDGIDVSGVWNCLYIIEGDEEWRGYQGGYEETFEDTCKLFDNAILCFDDDPETGADGAVITAPATLKDGVLTIVRVPMSSSNYTIKRCTRAD
ncbi:MAG: hypothetical protein P9M14_13560 [Candidatus Alcyoniella australis]|nr:hypothetical protein [Candidatus Alcyoniella australis]